MIRNILLALVFVFATNFWMSWQEGIRYVRADDSRSYEIIARAAPNLPESGPLYHHAQRILIHYVVGSTSKLLGADLGIVYQAFAIALAVLVLVLLSKILSQLKVVEPGRLLLLFAFAANPYTFRYYFLAPTMLADLLFVAGGMLVMLGLLQGRTVMLLFGGLVAVLGRQSALLMLPGISLWLFFSEQGRAQRFVNRLSPILGIWLLIGLAYYTLGIFVLPFTGHVVHEVNTFWGLIPWLSSELFSFKLLAEHGLRVLIPFILPVTLGLGFWLAQRSTLAKPPLEFWAALAIAAGIASQPLMLNPIDVGQNQSRQAAIGLFAVITALGMLFRQSPSSTFSFRASWLMVFAGVAVSSIHHLYTVIGWKSAAWFALAHILASIAAGIALYFAMQFSPKHATREE